MYIVSAGCALSSHAESVATHRIATVGTLVHVRNRGRQPFLRIGMLCPGVVLLDGCKAWIRKRSRIAFMQPEELSGGGSLSLSFGNPVASLWCGTIRWPVRCLEGDQLEVPGSGNGILDPYT